MWVAGTTLLCSPCSPRGKLRLDSSRWDEKGAQFRHSPWGTGTGLGLGKCGAEPRGGARGDLAVLLIAPADIKLCLKFVVRLAIAIVKSS